MEDRAAAKLCGVRLWVAVLNRDAGPGGVQLGMIENNNYTEVRLPVIIPNFRALQIMLADGWTDVQIPRKRDIPPGPEIYGAVANG